MATTKVAPERFYVVYRSTRGRTGAMHAVMMDNRDATECRVALDGYPRTYTKTPLQAILCCNCAKMLGLPNYKEI